MNPIRSNCPVDLDMYELILVPIDNLFADHAYQRPEQPAHVNDMVKRFNLLKFRPLQGNKRPNGTVAIIDGFQRYCTLKKLGYVKFVPVVVYRNPLDLREEAEAFKACNKDAKKVSAVQGFNAEVTSGDPLFVKIAEILEFLDLVISTNRRIRSISASSCLRTVVRGCGGLDGGGADILRQTLEILLDSYGGSSESLSASMINGVANFLYNANEKYLDTSLLAEVIESREPKEWIRTSEANQTIHRAITKSLFEVYAEAYSELYMIGITVEDLCK